MNVFVSCAKGLEYLLESETKELGLEVSRVSPQGVFGEASLKTLYKLCLHSRLANRVQIILFEGEAFDDRSIYQLCRSFAWHKLFSEDKTFAVEFHGTSDLIRNTMFGAQVIKDAIVDHFSAFNQRPNVSRDNPDIRIQAHFKNGYLTISFDMTGYSLHQRGYRLDKTEAPLKETLAAAMLIRAGWPELSKQGFDLYDPFCGSGTLVIEAFMMAANMAPGLLRQDQSFIHWLGHDANIWARVCDEARKNIKPVSNKIFGSDIDDRAIFASLENAKRAKVKVSFEEKDIKDCHAQRKKGLLITNPPFGERIGDDLIELYQDLGATAHEHFAGWELALLTSEPELARAVGLRSHKQYSFFNGALKCKMYCIKLDAQNRFRKYD